MSEALQQQVDKEVAQGEPYPWTRRRRFMYCVAAFCAASISYVLGLDKQGAVAETAVTMAFLTLGGITGSYVFGAVWQDVSHMRTTGALGYPAASRTSYSDLRAMARARQQLSSNLPPVSTGE